MAAIVFGRIAYFIVIWDNRLLVLSTAYVLCLSSQSYIRPYAYDTDDYTSYHIVCLYVPITYL